MCHKDLHTPCFSCKKLTDSLASLCVLSHLCQYQAIVQEGSSLGAAARTEETEWQSRARLAAWWEASHGKVQRAPLMLQSHVHPAIALIASQHANTNYRASPLERAVHWIRSLSVSLTHSWVHCQTTFLVRSTYSPHIGVSCRSKTYACACQPVDFSKLLWSGSIPSQAQASHLPDIGKEVGLHLVLQGIAGHLDKCGQHSAHRCAGDMGQCLAAVSRLQLGLAPLVCCKVHCSCGQCTQNSPKDAQVKVLRTLSSSSR